MNEIKLTDEEIVKALDICTSLEDDMDCNDGCPLFEEAYCVKKLTVYARYLIHRLQAENEDLEAKQKCHLELIDEKNEELCKKKVEIERLHKAIDEEFVSLKAVKAAENSPKAMKMLVESVGCVQKDTAKEILQRGKHCMPSGLREWIEERYGVNYEENN